VKCIFYCGLRPKELEKCYALEYTNERERGERERERERTG